MTGTFFVFGVDLAVRFCQELAESTLGDDGLVSFDTLGQVWIEDLRVGRRQFGAGDALVADVDAVEQGEGEVSPDLVATGAVHLVPVLDSGERFFQGALHRFGFHGEGGDEPFGVGAIACDAPLFLLEKGQGYGIGVVGCQELLFLAGESFQPEPLVVEFTLVLVGGKADEFDNATADGGDLVGGDADSTPVLLDGGLNLFHGEVRQRAAVGVVRPAAEAEEVGVFGASLGLAPSEPEPPLAVAAGEDALEVVGALHGLLGALAVVEHGLNVVEEDLVDERLVAALVLHAVVGHDPDVVRVAQHPVNLAAYECLWGSALVALAGQAPLLQRFGELAERPLPGGEGLEGPSDVIGSLRVDGDGSDLMPVDGLDGVDVADGRPVGGTSELGLLLHPLAGLRRKVRAVELSDGGHDAVKELAAGCLVDVL